MKDVRKNRLNVIEIMYIFMVIIISLVSFSLLHVASKANSEFSKNLVTARLLSQEGIKTIINLHNQNETSIIIGFRSYKWSQLFDGTVTLLSCVNPSDLTISCADFKLRECDISDPLFKHPCIEIGISPHTDIFWKMPEKENKIFSRKIRITNAEKNTKNITVFIWWIDPNGLHTSPITYKLIRNQK